MPTDTLAKPYEKTSTSDLEECCDCLKPLFVFSCSTATGERQRFSAPVVSPRKQKVEKNEFRSVGIVYPLRQGETEKKRERERDREREREGESMLVFFRYFNLGYDFDLLR